MRIIVTILNKILHSTLKSQMLLNHLMLPAFSSSGVHTPSPYLHCCSTLALLMHCLKVSCGTIGPGAMVGWLDEWMDAVLISKTLNLRLKPPRILKLIPEVHLLKILEKVECQ